MTRPGTPAGQLPACPDPCSPEGTRAPRGAEPSATAERLGSPCHTGGGTPRCRGCRACRNGPAQDGTVMGIARGDTALARPLTADPTAARPLRAWQQHALDRYEQQAPKDFLVTATPGAGKTTFAL